MQEEAKSRESRKYCCDHAAECAVHQLPYDSEYVRCNCPVGVGSVRHERMLSSTSTANPIETLARTAQGALTALQSGESELAARLLSDVLDRTQRGGGSGDAGGAPPER